MKIVYSRKEFTVFLVLLTFLLLMVLTYYFIKSCCVGYWFEILTFDATEKNSGVSSEIAYV